MDLVKIGLQPDYSHRCKIVLTIGSGSAHEPEQWQGLAHLLEHSLFLGSQSQTESLKAGAIQAELLQMGGTINASTQLFHTSYMLECPSNQFERALILLCALVFQPLLDPDAIIAERDIIEAEYQARCGDSWQQIQSVVQQLVYEHSSVNKQGHGEKAHPMHRFCAGNEASLGHHDTTLICALREFYYQHYQPDNISVFLQHPAFEHDPSFFTANFKDESALSFYVTQKIKAARSGVQPRESEITIEFPPLVLPAQKYAIQTPQSGYEWCWVLPSQLLPVIDQLRLPDGFQAKLRMISHKQLLLGIQYSCDLALSLNDMTNECQFMLARLALNPESSHPLSLMQVVQQALYHHYDLPLVHPDILYNGLVQQLRNATPLALIFHPEVQGEQQTQVFPTRFKNIDENYPALPANTANPQMPFIALRTALLRNADVSFSDVQSITCQDPFNHAALIWLQPTLSCTEHTDKTNPEQYQQDTKQVAHQLVWQGQQLAYQQLRIKQRLGYIVHVGYQEVGQQAGVLLLIQGQSQQTSMALLNALNQLLTQPEFSPNRPIPESLYQHWQNYQHQHELDDGSTLDWLPVAQWQKIQLISQHLPNK